MAQAVVDGSLRSLWKNTNKPRYFQSHHWDFTIVLTSWQYFISYETKCQGEKQTALGPGEGLPTWVQHSCSEPFQQSISLLSWAGFLSCGLFLTRGQLTMLSSETQISGQIWKAKQILLAFELSPRETPGWKKSHHKAFPPSSDSSKVWIQHFILHSFLWACESRSVFSSSRFYTFNHATCYTWNSLPHPFMKSPPTSLYKAIPQQCFPFFSSKVIALPRICIPCDPLWHSSFSPY